MKALTVGGAMIDTIAIIADDPDAHANPDDQDLDDGGLAGAELLAKELGATLIGEIDGRQG